MDTNDKRWLAEIERRAAVYDDLGEGGAGRLQAVDYLAIVALLGVLTLVFWTWAV